MMRLDESMAKKGGKSSFGFGRDPDDIIVVIKRKKKACGVSAGVATQSPFPVLGLTLGLPRPSLLCFNSLP